MKAFEIIQKHYATLGISPSNQSNHKYSFNKRILVGFLLFGYLILSQLAYCFCVAKGFMDYIVSICSTSASTIIFISFAAIVSRKSKIFECFDKMEKLIESRRKYPESAAFFLKTSRQIERLSKILYTFMAKGLLNCFILPQYLVSFAVYFTTDSGSDSFQLPYPMWFPFDSNNLIGYSIAFTIQYVIMGYEYFLLATSVSLTIGGFWFAISATKEFNRYAPMINDKAKAKVKAKANVNESTELKKLLSEFIFAHGTVKQVIHDLSDIFQPIIMSLFTWSLFSISIIMLIIQVELVHHDNAMPLSVMVSCGLFALVEVFISCELGERMSGAFEEIEYTIGQWHWYSFPFETKRKLRMIIVILQQPVSIECFGSISCTREVFKNIIHRAYSFFMVLGQLGD